MPKTFEELPGTLIQQKVFFLKKSIFFRFFKWFSRIFWAFHQISSAWARAQMLQSARDFQNHKIQDLRRVTHFLPCPYHLSSTFWRNLKLHCKKKRIFLQCKSKKNVIFNAFLLIFANFLAFFAWKMKHFTIHDRKKISLDVFCHFTPRLNLLAHHRLKKWPKMV